MTYSDYEFNIGLSESSTSTIKDTINSDFLAFGYRSGIQDYALTYDFDLYQAIIISLNLELALLGICLIQVLWHLQYKNLVNLDTTIEIGRDPLLAYEYAAYIEDDWKINALMKVNIGAHASAFNVNGKLYKKVQPRFAGRYY